MRRCSWTPQFSVYHGEMVSSETKRPRDMRGSRGRGCNGQGDRAIVAIARFNEEKRLYHLLSVSFKRNLSGRRELSVATRNCARSQFIAPYKAVRRYSEKAARKAKSGPARSPGHGMNRKLGPGGPMFEAPNGQGPRRETTRAQGSLCPEHSDLPLSSFWKYVPWISGLVNRSSWW